jgi:integrase
LARTLNRLSAAGVAKTKAKGLHADGGGLYLRVADGGTKSWVFRYRSGKSLHDMGLGPLHTVSLAEARQKAAEARKLRLEGADPIAVKRERSASLRAADAKRMTFRQAAEAYMASHSHGWRNAAHRRQWEVTLATYAYPIMGDISADKIDTGLVLECLQPIWNSKTTTASRLRGRIELILSFAATLDRRDGPNPARWRGHLDKVLPKPNRVRPVQHHAALHYRDVPAFMSKLDNSIVAAALRFCILTAARRDEVRLAVWEEIDFKARTWNVPANRMKGGRGHRVPLSNAALSVLRAMQEIRQSDYIFSGMRPGAPMSGGTMRTLVKQAAGADVDLHGFRSSFRDWCAEQTNFPREVAEMALAHAVGDAVERAYARTDLFEKRRKLMDAWVTAPRSRRTRVRWSRSLVREHHDSIPDSRPAAGHLTAAVRLTPR